VKNLVSLLLRVGIAGAVLVGGCARAATPDITDLTASQALKMMNQGQLTSYQYVSAVLGRANQLQSLNAFISTQDRTILLTEAALSDLRRFLGWARPLEGLPIVIKDNYNSSFLKTTAGTPALFSNQPSTNATALQNLINQGAIVIGKTNMHELAFGVTSNNAATGAVHNPYNLTMIPGGSSGGTAAAVAGRIVPFGLGTDTAGSIRIPASLSGTFGFHPSAGRYPRDGTVLISTTQDRVGTMARSVEDLLLLDEALSTQGSHVQTVPLQGLRLGIDRANFAANLDPETAVVFEAALTKLEQAGVTIVNVSLMAPANYASTIAALRFSVGFNEAPTNLSSYFQSMKPPVTILDVATQIASPDVKGVFSNFLVPGAPMAVTPAQYQAGLQARDTLRAAYEIMMTANNIRGLIFPTTVLPARPIGEDTTVALNGNQVPTTLIYSQNVVPGSYAGLAGLSIPVGLTSDGLPVGLEVDNIEGTDEIVLGIGLSMERAFGPLPAPPVH
jgi:indoleacetamide hydrolase